MIISAYWNPPIDPYIDFHPDPFYRVNSSTKGEAACHRGTGDAGWLGAAGTDCDTPVSLINATFKWIDANLKDSIDFVVWTGDSARHDNDEEIPRTEKQVTGLNKLLVTKFVEVFGKDDRINDTDPTNDFVIPIVPTFGNNDILPHNILSKGPNRWTKRYASIWNRFIPEEQRHAFERGGWFYVEVIPHQLAVFSLNTLYFFDSNSAVDGCADRSEPGYEQMEWLRIQLQFLRDRGMKAIITGHVPPARTDRKRSWDETCWQKYALWMRQYRDIVVGSMYGHTNLDHFVLQDSDDVDLVTMDGSSVNANIRPTFAHLISVKSSAEYLKELRSYWSHLPKPPSMRLLHRGEEGTLNENGLDDEDRSSAGDRNRRNRGKNRDYLDKIGGQWAERYSASFVSPSVIPKYFPTIRVIHYNITGLELDTAVQLSPPAEITSEITEYVRLNQGEESNDINPSSTESTQGPESKLEPEPNRNKKKHRRPKKPRFKVPKPPSKTSPPGPAYSPQPLTLLGYTQYYLNLTRLYNNDTIISSLSDDNSPDAEIKPEDGSGANILDPVRPKGHSKPVEFEVEYDTRDDSIYKLKDLTMRSLLDLATRIGDYQQKGDAAELEELKTLLLDVAARIEEGQSAKENVIAVEQQGEKKLDRLTSNQAGREPLHRWVPDPESEVTKEAENKGGKHKWRKIDTEVWLTFLGRAFVGVLPEDDVYNEFCQKEGFVNGEHEEMTQSVMSFADRYLY